MSIPVFYTYYNNANDIRNSINYLKGDFKIYIMYYKEIDKTQFDDFVNYIDMSCYYETKINFYNFFKIMITKYIDFDKIIYIDSKSIVRTNLNDIFNIDLSNSFLGVNKQNGYFVDDILVINVKKFKEYKMFERIISSMNYSEESLIVSMNRLINNYVALDVDVENDYCKYDPIDRRDDHKNPERIKIIEKIKGLEANGMFDVDAEDDPETLPIKPNTVDYECKKLTSKIKARISLMLARKFLNKMIKNKKIIIKDVIGAENFKNLNVGSIITCNHFNAFDSFAIHVAYDKSLHKKQKLFRIIREGNYTSFPGFYGFLMRNCRTMPLSSNSQVMKEFMKGVKNNLAKKHFILIYPEQSMWWNYRKPKPLKPGAFKLAAKFNAPVLPCFIGMKNSNIIGDDGFYVQEYTIFIEKPIYADESLSLNEKMEYLKNKNNEIWKDLYESFYNLPLVYETN